MQILVYVCYVWISYTSFAFELHFKSCYILIIIIARNQQRGSQDLDEGVPSHVPFC